MTDPIATSRRSFLKLFGATLAAAAAPLPLALAQELAAPLEPAFPPNVLHIKADGVWRAVSEIIRFDERQEIQVVSINLLCGGELRKFKGIESHDINFEGTVTPGFEILCRAFDELAAQRFAISMEGRVCEFGGLLMHLDKRFNVGNLQSLSASLGNVHELVTREL